MVNLCISAPISEPFLPNIFHPHGLLPFGHSDTGFLGTYSGFGPFRNFPFDKGYPFGNNNSYKHRNQIYTLYGLCNSFNFDNTR